VPNWTVQLIPSLVIKNRSGSLIEPVLSMSEVFSPAPPKKRKKDKRERMKTLEAQVLLGQKLDSATHLGKLVSFLI
jgi:hypothetical protein